MGPTKKKKTEEIGELGSLPNAKWQKFFEQAIEIETLPIASWKPAHLLFYFAKRYREAFDADYAFKFNSTTPAKSFEIFQVKRLAMQISSNPETLKGYIDWFFEQQKEHKRRFTSISAMTKDEVVNEYKWTVLPSKKKGLYLTRSSEIELDWREVLSDYGFGTIKTYGDLAFLYQAMKSQGLDSDMISKFNEALSHLQLEGFDPSI